ncbi:MAG TPA: hypothetical protein VHU87_03135 [Rhizomicrobium sp.]|jgi:hypothetical protein|nr:hypothetical protein [Rhizomicrobium sp.]
MVGKLIAALAITLALIASPAEARGSHGGSHRSMGGRYASGAGSRHFGGHYVNSRTNNHYTRHRRR